MIFSSSSRYAGSSPESPVKSNGDWGCENTLRGETVMYPTGRDVLEYITALYESQASFDAPEKIQVERMKHEHPLEYARLFPETPSEGAGSPENQGTAEGPPRRD